MKNKLYTSSVQARGYLTEGHLENDRVLTQQQDAPANDQRINFIGKINMTEER